MAGRILLVEDDPLFRATVRDTLTAAGYRVDEAADGLEGVARVAASHHDLVLLDYDLPRMMGDEALERMLALRPGLVCLVLSGKDDLHQALWMGRRGAYGWVDKYIGSERLLAAVADGLRTRPHGFDLLKLVATFYPQSIAAPFIKLARVPAAASAEQRLHAQREVFEALLEFLGAAALATYIHRGLLEQPLNARLLRAVERPSPAAWFEVLQSLAPRLAATEQTGWWPTLAATLERPLAGHEPLQQCCQALDAMVAPETSVDPRSPGGTLATLQAFLPLWQAPSRLPAEQSQRLAGLIGRALGEVLAALAILADVELLHVRQVTLQSDGAHAHQLTVLSGVGIQYRELARAAALRPENLYLTLRGSGELIAPVSPLMQFAASTAGGIVPQAVFVLHQLVPDRRATFVSHGCDQLHVVEDASTLEAIRHVSYSLDPSAARFSHLLRNVAVALYDLSGYTQLTRERGPAVAREFVRRMVSTVSAAVERHGGQVAGFVGDEVSTCFAEPVPALRAAQEVLATLQSFNQRNPDAALHLHVGLDFGPGVVEGNQVWGDVINRAKRCQMLATADEIVVSAGFAAQLPGDHPFVLQPFRGQLKGFDETEAWQVRWQKDGE